MSTTDNCTKTTNLLFMLQPNITRQLMR